MGECFNHNHTMLTPSRAQWFPRAFTFLVWALVTSSAVFWGLRWQGKANTSALMAPMLSSALPVDASAVALLLGSPGAVAAPVVNVSSRFALAGVVAQAGSRVGAALIGVDGKSAKSYSVGSRVEDGLWLVSVGPRRASLGASSDAAPSIVLDLPVVANATAAKATPVLPAPAVSASAAALSAPLPTPLAAPVASAQPVAQATEPTPARSRRRIRNAGTADTPD